MWHALTSPGIATAQLDMTQALAPLGIGLVGLLALSAAGIVWAAVQPSVSRIMQIRLTPTLQADGFTPDFPRTLPSIL